MGDAWERAGPSRHRRHWVWPVLAIAAIVLAALVVLIARDRPTATLAVGPTAVPRLAGNTGDRPPEVAGLEPNPRVTVQLIDATRGNGPLLPDAGGLTLVAADNLSRLRVINLATGASKRMQLEDPETQSNITADTMVVVGDDVVVDVNNDVVLVSNGERRAIRLARDHRAIPTAADDGVWVVSGSSPNMVSTASLLSLDGTPTFQVPLPALADPVAGTRDSLIVTTPGQMVRIAADGSRQVVAAGPAIASDGERLAWLTCGADLSCAVAMGTIADPDQVRLQLEPAHLPASGALHGAFSPDGRWLALPLHRFDEQGDERSSSISIIDTAAGVEVGRAQASDPDQFATPLAWSPDSRWLAIAQDGRVRMWDATTAALTELDAGPLPTEALALR